MNHTIVSKLTWRQQTSTFSWDLGMGLSVISMSGWFCLLILLFKSETVFWIIITVTCNHVFLWMINESLFNYESFKFDEGFWVHRFQVWSVKVLEMFRSDRILERNFIKGHQLGRLLSLQMLPVLLSMGFISHVHFTDGSSFDLGCIRCHSSFCNSCSQPVFLF